MESFKPTRLKINFRLSLFIAVIPALFIWALYAGADMLLSRGSESINGPRKVSLEALGDFNFDGDRGAIDDVPARYRKLDGQRVTLEGFMFSRSGRARVHDFELVGPYEFHGPPLVQQRVFVHSAVELPHIDGECRVVGTLHVRILKNEIGTITSLFTMDLDKCREL